MAKAKAKKHKDSKKDALQVIGKHSNGSSHAVAATNGSHNGAVDTHNGTEPKMSRKTFEEEVRKLQVELVKLQEWVKATGTRVIVVFEGRDTAGKGGVIKAITERTSPRVFRVVALPAPTDREKSQMYIQRYITHFPAAGEIVLFDRSWYNRAGVERVMGFASPQQVEGFLRDVPPVERAITNGGILLVKYWLEVTAENQTKRIKQRIDEYVKIWKLSPMDMESYTRWDDYTKARDAMFEATDTAENPWYIVDSNDQRRGRLNCISHLLSLIPYEEVQHAAVKLPDRKVKEDNPIAGHHYHMVPEKF
jgi:polyphosphate kinase